MLGGPRNSQVLQVQIQGSRSAILNKITTRDWLLRWYFGEICYCIKAFDIFRLTTHDFVAKHLSAHLRDSKANLGDDTAIILLDFAENYAFVIQDAAQGFYWDNSQATHHPFAVYYREPEGEPQHLLHQ